jgi:hypothetical protein
MKMPLIAVSIGAIVGGVAAGIIALLCIIGGYIYWRRRHPKEAFFDVPGKPLRQITEIESNLNNWFFFLISQSYDHVDIRFFFRVLLKFFLIHTMSFFFSFFFFFFTAQEESEVNLGQLKRFSLSQLRIATENFSARNEIGRGGFGRVYKGVLSDGTAVAVKRLKEDRNLGNEQQFQTEVSLRLDFHLVMTPYKLVWESLCLFDFPSSITLIQLFANSLLSLWYFESLSV